MRSSEKRAMNQKQLKSAIDEFDFNNANDQTNITINMSGIRRLLKQKKTEMSQMSNLTGLNLTAGKEVSKIDQLDLGLRPSYRLRQKPTAMIRKTTGSSLKMTENHLKTITESKNSEGLKQISFTNSHSKPRGRITVEGYIKTHNFGNKQTNLKTPEVFSYKGNRDRVKTVAFDDYQDFKHETNNLDRFRQTEPIINSNPIIHPPRFKNPEILEMDDFMDYDEVKRVKKNLRKKKENGEFNNFQKLDNLTEESDVSSESLEMDSFDEEKEHRKFEEMVQKKKSIKDMILRRKAQSPSPEINLGKNNKSGNYIGSTKIKKEDMFKNLNDVKSIEKTLSSQNRPSKKLNTDISIHSGTLAPNPIHVRSLKNNQNSGINRVRSRSQSRFNVDVSDFKDASFQGSKKHLNQRFRGLKRDNSDTNYPSVYITKQTPKKPFRSKVSPSPHKMKADSLSSNSPYSHSPNVTPSGKKQDPKLYSYISTSRGDFSPLTSQLRNKLEREEGLDIVDSNLLTSQMRRKLKNDQSKKHSKLNRLRPNKSPSHYKHNIYSGHDMDQKFKNYLNRSRSQNSIRDTPKSSIRSRSNKSSSNKKPHKMDLKNVLKPYKIKTVGSINQNNTSSNSSRNNSNLKNLDSNFRPKRGNTVNDFTPSQFLDEVNDIDKFDPFSKTDRVGTTSIQESKTYLVDMKNQKVSVVEDENEYNYYLDKNARRNY